MHDLTRDAMLWPCTEALAIRALAWRIVTATRESQEA